MTKTKIYRTFTKNLPTIFQKMIFTKLVQNHFPKVFCGFSKFLRFVQKLRISQKIMAHGFYQKHFLDFRNFPKFFENFETIMINIHFQCSNERNSTLTSATREEMLTTRGEGQLPSPNEWNSTITSATRKEMLTPVRIAKGGRRTGAVRIATASQRDYFKLLNLFIHK